MERSDALRIVKKLGLRLPFLAKNLEMQAEWAQDIYEDFGGHSYDWVLAQCKDILKKHGSEYDIKLDWLISELRCRVNLKRYLDLQALPAPDEEPPGDPEENKTNAAKVSEMVAGLVMKAKPAIKPAEEKAEEIYHRAVGRSSDDLTEEED